MSNSRYLAVILAAGKGTRLKSNAPKPMYKVMGKPMIDHIVSTVESFNDIDILVVVGYKKEAIIKHINQRAEYVHQRELNGTGHALLECRHHIKKYNDIFVFMGDSPLISKDMINQMISEHSSNQSDCTFLYSSYPMDLPYAHLIFNSEGHLEYLVEDCNADENEKLVKELFTSQYLFKSSALYDNLQHLKEDNNTGEIYLTEIINTFINKRLSVSPVFIADYWKLIGINSYEDIKIIRDAK